MTIGIGRVPYSYLNVLDPTAARPGPSQKPVAAPTPETPTTPKPNEPVKPSKGVELPKEILAILQQFEPQVDSPLKDIFGNEQSNNDIGTLLGAKKSSANNIFSSLLGEANKGVAASVYSNLVSFAYQAAAKKDLTV